LKSKMCKLDVTMLCSFACRSPEAEADERGDC